MRRWLILILVILLISIGYSVDTLYASVANVTVILGDGCTFDSFLIDDDYIFFNDVENDTCNVWNVSAGGYVTWSSTSDLTFSDTNGYYYMNYTTASESGYVNYDYFDGLELWLPFNESCTQESANASNSCGGLDTGSYELNEIPGTTADLENIVDGDWTTRGYTKSSTENFIYINYTTPANTVSASWVVGEQITFNVFENETLNIGDCFDSTKLQLRINYTKTGISWACYDAGWTILRYSDYDDIVEEQIIWYYKENVTDYSGNDLDVNFSIEGNKSNYTEDYQDKISEAILLNGVDEYMNVSDNFNSTITNSITTSSWFKTNDTNMMIMGKGSNPYTLSQYISAAGYVRCEFDSNNQSVGSQWYTGINVSSGIWHNLVCTYDGSGIALYLDSINVNSSLYTGNIDFTGVDNLIVGDRGGSLKFNGSLDEVRIYNRVLSDWEIYNLYYLYDDINISISSNISNFSTITDDFIVKINYSNFTGLTTCGIETNDSIVTCTNSTSSVCTVPSYQVEKDILFSPYCDNTSLRLYAGNHTLTIDNVYDISFYGTNIWNSSSIPVLNATLTNSSGSYKFNTTNGNLTIPYSFVGNTELINITTNASDYMNSYNYYSSGNNLSAEYSNNFWQAVVNISVKSNYTQEYITGSLMTINDSSISKNITSATGSQLYRTNVGLFTINASATSFSPSDLVESTFTLGNTYNITINLSKYYNLTIYREETGLELNFTETSSGGTCIDVESNVTYNYSQLAPSSYSCGIINETNWSILYPCENAVDSISTTYAKSDNTSYLYLNYSKPTGVLEDLSRWVYTVDLLNSTEYTIPTLCWSQTPIQFRVTSNIGSSQTILECYNGATYTNIATLSNNAEVYEEYILWRYNETENVSTCTSGTNYTIDFDIYCQTTKINYNTTDPYINLNSVDCAYDYWYIILQSSTDSYFRTIKPNYTTNTVDIYMLDLKDDTAIEMIFNLNDLASAYEDGWLIAKKYINGSLIEVIRQQFDIENKVIFWLDQNEQYYIYAENSEGEEVFLDKIIADSASTKTLILPGLPFYAEYDFDDVSIILSGDKSIGTATLNYTDWTIVGFANLTWVIYEYNTSTIVFNETQLNGYNTSMTVTGLLSNTSYSSYVYLDHNNNNYDKIFTRPLWWSDRTEFPGFEAYKDDIKLWIATGFPLMILMIASVATITWLFAIALLFTGVFYNFGWYTPLGISGLVPFIIILAIISVFMLKRKLKKSE